MDKLKVITYEKARLEYFQKELAHQNRRLDYAIKHGSCWDCADRGEEVSFYQDIVIMLEEKDNVVNDAHNEGYDVGYWAGRRDYEPKWIPVTERLPDPKFAREWYLVALESGCVKSLAFEKEGRTDNLFRAGWHETASPVTHWMPLPEPPKEKT